MKFGPIKLGGGNKDKKNTKEKKGFLDGSTKKKKESRETVELKLQAELDMIAERYQNTIVSETAKIREKRRNGRDDERNVIRVCDAFYGLLVIKEAKENLEEIRSTTDLCNSMNRMGTALKVLNRLDASQETPNKFTLRRQIGKMRRSAEKGDSRMDKVYKDMEEYVPSDLIDRLVRGESVYECLQGESLPQNSDISKMFDSMLDGLTDEPVNDTVVEGNIASISDLISELSDDV